MCHAVHNGSALSLVGRHAVHISWRCRRNLLVTIVTRCCILSIVHAWKPTEVSSPASSTSCSSQCHAAPRGSSTFLLVHRPTPAACLYHTVLEAPRVIVVIYLHCGCGNRVTVFHFFSSVHLYCQSACCIVWTVQTELQHTWSKQRHSLTMEAGIASLVRRPDVYLEGSPNSLVSLVLFSSSNVIFVIVIARDFRNFHHRFAVIVLPLRSEVA